MEHLGILGKNIFINCCKTTILGCVSSRLKENVDPDFHGRFISNYGQKSRVGRDVFLCGFVFQLMVWLGGLGPGGLDS